MVKCICNRKKPRASDTNTLNDQSTLDDKSNENTKVHDEKSYKNETLLDIQELLENDPNNISLTKQILTKQMATELMNIKTSKGDSLKQCIKVNVKNPHCKYPYAVSAECYNTFVDFFAEVIEAIHGIPKQPCQLKPDFACLKYHFPIDLNHKNRFRVIYSEASIKRNLQGIHFTPRMSMENCSEVVNKIKEPFDKVCKEFDPVSTLPFEWELKMDAIKNELDDIGSMKHYPKNVHKIVYSAPSNISIGAILNFDDHVNYIISSNDGRIGTLIVVLARILDQIERSDMEYEAHPIFGHLTINPAHIGTGFFIKIIARFPFISRLTNYQYLVKEFGVKLEKRFQCKETGLLIIFNSKTLNKTESMIIMDFIKAYKKLCSIENELELITPMAVQNQVTSVETLVQLRNKIMVNPTKTYTKKYLTEQIVNDYGKLKTKFNATLAHCIKHNKFFPNSLYPRACDAECYIMFDNFFNPIILEHNNSKSFDHPINSLYGVTSSEERYMLSHPNIFSYRVRFVRNISKYPFPNLMTAKHRAELEKLIIQIFKEIPVEFEGEYCPLSEVYKSPYYDDLKTHKLLKFPNEIDNIAGFCTDWPTNRGVYIVKKNEAYPYVILIVFINITDHIKVISYDSSGKSLSLCYERATEFMHFLDLRLSNLYAKRSGYGYLSSYPNKVGCGLRISVLVLIKNLGEHRNILEKYCMKNNLVYRGTNGNGSPAINNVFDISLKSNLNLSEIQMLRTFTLKMKDLMLKERDFDTRIPKPTSMNLKQYKKEILEELDDNSLMGFDSKPDYVNTEDNNLRKSKLSTSSLRNRNSHRSAKGTSVNFKK